MGRRARGRAQGVSHSTNWRKAAPSVWWKDHVMLELFQILRHDLLNKLNGFFISRLVVDQDFSEVTGQVIT